MTYEGCGRSWHYKSSLALSSYLANSRRKGDADSLKYFATGANTFAADCQTLSTIFYDSLLKSFEVLFDISPFKIMACLIKAAIQLFFEHER